MQPYALQIKSSLHIKSIGAGQKDFGRILCSSGLQRKNTEVNCRSRNQKKKKVGSVIFGIYKIDTLGRIRQVRFWLWVVMKLC